MGRRIHQKWLEPDGNERWYRGTVLAVKKGRDGDADAVYEVDYEGDGRYDVEDLHKDYVGNNLTFTDI